ncbi:MAG: low specificity L-threonine aldolase [Candidatus Azobacteroides sp.]|nr:low specificity L-threonine aldolase [Candidatus Azobacteroides sp.]
MKSFASDNNSGIHPQIIQAIIDVNQGHAVGYGDDERTGEADLIFRKIFGEDVRPYYVFNGTGANVVALQALTRSYQSIICATTAHINSDECGAPVKATGAVLKPVSTPDGKLTPELIAGELHELGVQHHSQPQVIYISQSTEMGTVYTVEEVKAICDFAHSRNLYVHMDGSRLANACAHLGVGLRELSRDCGVDILSFGGTKNGMMLGEAVIAFRPDRNESLMYYRKQSAQLYSKMRYLSAQYIAYFHNDLWLQNAAHANAMAKYLADRIRNLPGVRFTQKVESNSLFLILPQPVIQKMLENYFFYIWNESANEIRLVCSWDTTPADADAFFERLKTILLQSSTQ